MALVSISDVFAGQKLDIPTYGRVMEGLGHPAVLITLIPGRCGSSYFAEMIARTKFCGTGEEAFNERSTEDWKRPAPDFIGFFSKAMRYNLAGGIVWIQITPERFEHLSKMVDKVILDTWRYSVILRRDIIAQAISYVYAVNSGIWHSTQSESRVSLEVDREATIEQVILWTRTLEALEAKIRTILRTHASVKVLTQFYEDIVSCSREEILRFFRFYGIAYDLSVVLDNDFAVLKKLEKLGAIEIYDQITRRFPWTSELVTERRRMVATTW